MKRLLALGLLLCPIAFAEPSNSHIGDQVVHHRYVLADTPSREKILVGQMSIGDGFGRYLQLEITFPEKMEKDALIEVKYTHRNNKDPKKSTAATTFYRITKYNDAKGVKAWEATEQKWDKKKEKYVDAAIGELIRLGPESSPDSFSLRLPIIPKPGGYPFGHPYGDLNRNATVKGQWTKPTKLSKP